MLPVTSHKEDIMSKTKLLLDLVTDIRSVADDLEAICQCMADNEPEAATVAAGSPAQTGEAHANTPAPDTAPPSNGNGLAPNERIDPETGEIITLDLPTLRALAASKAQSKEQKAQMKALLQKHGVSKLTELPLSDYFDFQKEVAAIV